MSPRGLLQGLRQLLEWWAVGINIPVDERVKPERFSRTAASHLLDLGYSASYLKAWAKGLYAARHHCGHSGWCRRARADVGPSVRGAGGAGEGAPAAARRTAGALNDKGKVIAQREAEFHLSELEDLGVSRNSTK
ncbi:hypothetical protein O1Q96_23880 [Streptomyces sp. Qhu-G9]|uniref:hypothetical protein n=1 Tax=Streptomyces sp. Qhu-G9 TaxID=3452799 RepID=UPI0022ABE014|nr:hypothetical protein [Streptomyces aurantiacus]WAU82514.1 hypothetical protein O1Q96_23880 [Streptomyces aurantiacus]